MGATRTRYHLARSTSVAYKRYQWTSWRARARLGPLEFGMSDHPRDPCNMHAALGMASSSSLPIGNYSTTLITH
jgi:hypothetical protein